MINTTPPAHTHAHARTHTHTRVHTRRTHARLPPTHAHSVMHAIARGARFFSAPWFPARQEVREPALPLSRGWPLTGNRHRFLNIALISWPDALPG